MNDLRTKLRIPDQNLKEINDFLLRDDNPLINDILELILPKKKTSRKRSG